MTDGIINAALKDIAGKVYMVSGKTAEEVELPSAVQSSKWSVHFDKSINDDLNVISKIERSVYTSRQLYPMNIKYKTSESIKIIN